jgi:type IV pilus assembly protein PilA
MGTMHGQGRTEGGFTLIELMIVIAIIAIIASIAVPSMVGARKNANEGTAIASLRTLITAERIYRERALNGVNDYASSIAALGSATLIDSALSTGTRNGYVYSIISADHWTWQGQAMPQILNVTGDRTFYVDDTGVIRFTSVGLADMNSPPVGE